MFEKQEQRFNRFFFPSFVVKSIGFNGFGEFSGLGGLFNQSARNVLSEVIKDSIYLGNFPKSPFASFPLSSQEPNSALLVSCLDLEEMANSKLLLEPDARLKYHILPMEDVTANPGCIEHIIDTIRLMSEFAMQGKKIHVHCFQGVGRSAMMTAIFLAYRYMLQDETVQTCLNPFLKSPLNIENNEYIVQLYNAACKLVSSQRPCCQFDSRERFKLAITVLQQLKENPEPKRDENYSFLAQLVQSRPFKKLTYLYFNDFNHKTNELENSQRDKENIRQFFTSFLLNKDEWYTQLAQACLDDCPPATPLSALSQHQELRELFVDLCELFNELSEVIPNSEYSKPVQQYKALQSTSYSAAI